MHRFFIPQPYKEQMTISGMDAHHIQDVLRMQVGTRVQVVADDGVSALMEITGFTGNTVAVKEIEILRESHEPSVQLTLLQGLAKGEKMELIIQKAVEIGVGDIHPVAMVHSVVRLDGPKAAKKVERWQKISEAAAKQSKRDRIPTIHPVRKLTEVLAELDCDLLLMAYESENQLGLREALQRHPQAERIALIIGPEGGLSNEEVAAAEEAGAQVVTLGPRILRTETAGLVAASAILYETGNLGG